MNKVRKGALVEHRAICWLLDNGYEVFKNVSPEGPFDVVAVKDGEATFIDVKDVSSTKDLSRAPIKKFRASALKHEGLNMKILYVSGDQITWRAGDITDATTNKLIQAYLKQVAKEEAVSACTSAVA